MRKFFIFLFLIFASFPLFADENLRLEGISYDSKNPGMSIAVINGSFLQQGDAYRDYRVVEIKADSVWVSNSKTGKTHILRITGQLPIARKTEKTPSQTSSDLKEIVGSKESTVAQSQIDQSMAEAIKNPLAILQKAKDAAALADLRRIHSTATIYQVEHEGDQVTFQKLTKEGLIPSDSETSGEGQYRYEIQTTDKGIIASAHPVNAAAGLKPLFINEDGDFSTGQVKPAKGGIPPEAY